MISMIKCSFFLSLSFLHNQTHQYSPSSSSSFRVLALCFSFIYFSIYLLRAYTHTHIHSYIQIHLFKSVRSSLFAFVDCGSSLSFACMHVSLEYSEDELIYSLSWYSFPYPFPSLTSILTNFICFLLY